MAQDSMEHDGSGEFLSLDGPVPTEGFGDQADDCWEFVEHQKRASMCLQKEEWPEAESLLRKALALDPLR